MNKRAAGRAPATIETITKRIGRLIAFLGDRPTGEITADDIRHWLLALKRGRTGAPTSDVYVEDHRKEAAAFLAWAVREKHLRRSPMEGVDRYRVTRPEIHTLTSGEIAQLLEEQPETMDGIRNRAILAFIYDTGVRVGELVRVNVGDVDLEAGTARIVGKNRKVETVALSPALRSILWTYIERARPRELFAGTGQLFVSRSGDPLTTNAVRQWMRRAGDRAGLRGKRVSPHVIRSSAATHFAVNGASEFMVQRFLRHSDPTMSRKYVRMAAFEIGRVHATASPLQRLSEGA